MAENAFFSSMSARSKSRLPVKWRPSSSAAAYFACESGYILATASSMPTPRSSSLSAMRPTAVFTMRSARFSACAAALAGSAAFASFLASWANAAAHAAAMAIIRTFFICSLSLVERCRFRRPRQCTSLTIAPPVRSPRRSSAWWAWEDSPVFFHSGCDRSRR